MHMSKLSGKIECEHICGVTSSYFQNAQQGSSSVSVTEPKNRCLALQSSQTVLFTCTGDILEDAHHKAF